MNATIVAVDLAKNVFELAVADADWHIAQRQRLTRAKFFGFFVQLAPCQVVMEACGSAHYLLGAAHCRLGPHGASAASSLRESLCEAQ